MKTTTILFVGLLLLAGGLLASCAGFNFGDVVRVRTPNAVQNQTGLPASMSLNEAEVEYENWFQVVQSAGTRWKNDLSRGAEVTGLLNQLTLQALNETGPTLQGIPVLGPMLPVLTGLVGLGLGVGGKRKGKEDSFNAGLQKGKELGNV